MNGLNESYTDEPLIKELKDFIEQYTDDKLIEALDDFQKNKLKSQTFSQ